MPAKLYTQAQMMMAIENHFDRKCGKGWMFVNAIRIEADFSKERDEDKTSVNLSRLMVFPAQGDEWVFRSRNLHVPEDCTYHTPLSWTEAEIKTAYDSGEFARMLEPDPLNNDIYYILYDDASYHHKCREVDDAVNRLVSSVMHKNFKVNAVCRSKHMVKSINDTEKRAMSFKHIMLTELLPSLRLKFMQPRAECDDAVELDPMRLGENLNKESASVFVAHAKQ